MSKTLIITPVKDSIDTFELTARSIVKMDYAGEFEYIVYNDNSTADNSVRLDKLALDLGFKLVHLSQIVDTPSPNYRFVLQETQRIALSRNANLLIVESDVAVNIDTLNRLEQQINDNVGMVAAVTVDENNLVNFPYLYASKYAVEPRNTRKRLSFCCTLITNKLLQKYDFMLLDPSKAWYDVTISHNSVKLGMNNILDMTNRVVHRPHSSRPWKLLKYTNPLKYYWLKYTKGLDKI